MREPDPMRVVVAALTTIVLAVSCTSATPPDEDAAAPGGPVTSAVLAPDTSPSSTTTTSTTTTPTTTTTAPPPEPAELDELVTFVEQRSGLVFAEPPEIGRSELGPEELDLPDGFFVTERLWRLFATLGLVGPEDDRRAAELARLEQVRGVCCPLQLFPTDDDPLLTDVVIVHELTHLLDRQRVYGPSPGEAEVLRLGRSVTEGNANRVALDYRELLLEQGADPSSLELLDWAHPDLPDAILQVVEFAYDEGASFSSELEARGGLALVEESFVRPPVSSEQVIDVDAWVAEEPPVEVDRPELPTGAELVDTGSIGSFVLRLVVEPELGEPAATELVTAWAGDTYVIHRGEQGVCLDATILMDDAAAADRLLAALADRGLGAAATEDAAEVAVTECVDAID